MVRYHNFDIVFAEIPDETTLAINITNCPNSNSAISLANGTC